MIGDTPRACERLPEAAARVGLDLGALRGAFPAARAAPDREVTITYATRVVA